MDNISKNQLFQFLEKNLFLSDLSEEENLLWKNILLNSSIDQLQIIAEALREDKQNLRILTKNLEDKSRAVKSKSNSLWDEIIKNEKEALRGK